MTYSLIPFKRNETSLEVLASASIKTDLIELKYELSGPLESIMIPDEVSRDRKIGLWESTCFEFFLLDKNSSSYYEFNFSPSGMWNCFFFKKSGNELSESPCQISKFEVDKGANYFELVIHIDLNSLNQEFQNIDEFLVNLTAVLEKEKLSYWALSHGLEKPNFHDFKTYVEIKKVR
ncbi:hypothetical protein [Halobacteriovorax sp. JY17]|uniref:hypothetical protein n=1 Tax=Halobacteriovorax sp. JY17 TaxID=2014617 RepID=UPI000C3C68E1|nr:hypothetical protein [Halobacteriovorax sp. JY17]PIK15467.1 MAG: hypothetical protein CES88_01745 [Halobacteriovorax sp. JY17]